MWFAVQKGIVSVLPLVGGAMIVRLVVTRLEQISGLTQRAWYIGMTGLIAVPALTFVLIALVRFPLAG